MSFTRRDDSCSLRSYRPIVVTNNNDFLYLDLLIKKKKKKKNRKERKERKKLSSAYKQKLYRN